MSVERTTIEEVAAPRFGVSPGTVFRVLSGETKENRPAIAAAANASAASPNSSVIASPTPPPDPCSPASSAPSASSLPVTGTNWYPIAALNGIYAALAAAPRCTPLQPDPLKNVFGPRRRPHLFSESAVDGLIVNLLWFSVPSSFSQPPASGSTSNLNTAPSIPTTPPPHPSAFAGSSATATARSASSSSSSETNAHYSVNDRLTGFCTAMQTSNSPIIATSPPPRSRRPPPSPS